MQSFEYSTIVCNIIGFISVISALLVITVSNPVNSVLWLIIAFVSVASYLVTAGITYIGLSYIIVYVGAIAVLFLFVVMILNLNVNINHSNSGSNIISNSWPIVIIIVIITVYGLIYTSQSIGVNNTPIDFSISKSIISILNQFILNNGSNIIVNTIDNINSDYGIINNNNSTNKWWSTDIDSNLINLSQIKVLGLTLYTNGAVWLMLISVLFILAILVPLTLAYTSL